MSSSTKKTDAQLFNSFANAFREYKAAWAKHGSPDRCAGILPEADMTLDDIRFALDELRKGNETGTPTLSMVFFEEFMEMLEAALMGDIKAFKIELAQCHAVIERIDDWVVAHSDDLKRGACDE